MSFYLRVAGVGGQGTVHLAKTLAGAAAKSNVKVTMIERPRSAMRLGPITCDLCFEAPEFAPFILPGTADAVLGMEPLDGIMNAAYYLKKDGLVLLQEVPTPTIDEVVLLEKDERRTEWKQQLEERGATIVTVNPEGENMQGRNYYMLGAFLQLCRNFPVSVEAVEQELQGKNLELFRQGLSAKL